LLLWLFFPFTIFGFEHQYFSFVFRLLFKHSSAVVDLVMRMVHAARASLFSVNMRRRSFVLHSIKNIRRLSSQSADPPRPIGAQRTAATPASLGIPKDHPGVGKFVNRSDYLKDKKSKELSGKQLFLRAGLPFVFFSLGAWWVLTSAIDGKLKERAVSRREVSQSERQAVMEEEHEDMMEKLTKAAKKDFDNTKRIERPEDILARRRAEREKRNIWYRRLWRRVKGEE
jgi:Cytochrome c oxidase assembly protein COX16